MNGIMMRILASRVQDLLSKLFNYYPLYFVLVTILWLYKIYVATKTKYRG